jgi:uridine kinase
MRITKDLPFGFETDGQIQKLVDRKSSPQRFWTLVWQVPNIKLAKDYAIVARIHDKVTGQPVIVVAGILGAGTEAASEVVSNPIYLDAMLQKAPKNWEELNLEAVIETDVIDGHPGPPNVLAVTAW